MNAFRKLLLWINILSLDAPLVALVWQDFFASNLGVNLGLTPRLVLGLSDLDGLRGGPLAGRLENLPGRGGHTTPPVRAGPPDWPGRGVDGGAFARTAALARHALPAQLFRRGLVLVGFVAVYFAANQWPGRSRRLNGLKEIGVGVLFAAGTLVFVLPQAAWIPSAARLWWPATAWSLLIFLNCYGISCWELERDRAEKQDSLLTRWPFLVRSFRTAALLLTVLALAPLLAGSAAASPRVDIAIAASSLGLGILDGWGGVLGTDALRVTADMALLTPLLLHKFL